MTKSKTTAYLLICLGCITISFNVAAVTAAVPEISRWLQRPDFLVSQIIPYYLIPYGFGALLYAPLSRFLTYRTILTVTMGLYAVFSLLCARAAHIDQLLISRIGMGVFGASAIPIGLMVIGEIFERHVRGRLVGVFFGCSFVASLFGVALAGLASWQWLFIIPALIGALNAVCLQSFRVPELNIRHSGHINYLRAVTNISIRKVFIFIFLISMLYHGVHKWYGVYLDRVYHFPKSTISLYFVMTLIGGMTGQVLGGVLSDKFGRNLSVIVGVAGLGVSVCLLMGTYTKLLLGFILFFIASFWTIGHNGISTILTDFSDADRPIIASLNSSVRFVAGGLGFALSAYFVPQSFSLTFFAIGCLILLLLYILKYVLPKGEAG